MKAMISFTDPKLINHLLKSSIMRTQSLFIKSPEVCRVVQSGTTPQSETDFINGLSGWFATTESNSPSN